jgi:peroxiredoxin
MQALEENEARLAKHNAVALGVSVDPSPSKKAWAETLKIAKTRLLSDFWPHGAAAAALGLFHDKEGFSDRAVVILDEEQAVRFVKVYAIPDLPDIEEQIRFIETL